MQVELLKNISQTTLIYSFPVIPVINDQRCRCPDSHGDQTLYVQISGHIIPIKQKVTEQQCRMIKHHHIVASKHHKQQDTYRVHQKFLDQTACIRQPRAKRQYCKHDCQRTHSMRCTDSEISEPKCHHTQQHHNTYDTVLISKDFTESNDHCHTECHGQKNFKQIDCRMAYLVFSIGTAANQRLGTGLIQLQFLIYCHSFFLRNTKSLLMI